jgi:hypothetical protein
MVGFVILFCWLALAMVFILFAKLCDNSILLAVGGAMAIMTAMVADITW